MTIKLKNINNEYIIDLDLEEFYLKKDNESVSFKNKKNNDKNQYFTSFFSDDDRQKLSQLKNDGIKRLFIKVVGKDVFYSSLLGAKIFAVVKEVQALGFEADLSRLDDDIKKIVLMAFKDTGNYAPAETKKDNGFLEKVGFSTFYIWNNLKNGISFILESFQAIVNFFGGTAIYRKKDFWFCFEDCSYKAVGITVLVSFLVGLIIAFVGAIQLRSFGAEIYVASMVCIGMTRIMAAIMVGIVMAGRTGSSFAATLGTMQVNEEIDALKTLGIKIYDYLVAPRIVALVLTIPFLTILADIMGILGGAVVGVFFLDISLNSYLEYSLNVLRLL